MRGFRRVPGNIASGKFDLLFCLAAQQQISHGVVSGVSENPLASFARLFLKLNSPQPLAATRAPEIITTGCVQYRYPGELERISARRVHSRATCCHRSKSCIPDCVQNSGVPSAAGTGEVIDSDSTDLFKTVFRHDSFLAQAVTIDIRQIRVAERVTPDFKTEGTQFPQLWMSQESGFAEKINCDVKSCTETELFQKRRSAQSVGFAAVVKRDVNAFAIE